MMLKQIFDKIQKEVSGEVAFFHVSEIVQHHRIQVSPGIREAVNYSVNTWKKYGMNAEVKSWPSTGKEFAWTSQMPLEWSCEDAELSLIEPANQARSLARFIENKISLIQRSFPTPKQGVEAEVVIIDKGEEENDYKKIDVSGKIVINKDSIGLESLLLPHKPFQ